MLDLTLRLEDFWLNIDDTVRALEPSQKINIAQQKKEDFTGEISTLATYLELIVHHCLKEIKMMASWPFRI